MISTYTYIATARQKKQFALILDVCYISIKNKKSKNKKKIKKYIAKSKKMWYNSVLRLDSIVYRLTLKVGNEGNEIEQV